MRLSSFDRTVLSVLSAIFIATGIILWRGDRVGAQISQSFPADGGEVSSLGKIGVVFKQPMQTSTVESRTSIEPAVPGHFVWEGNTLWYIFDRPLQQGTQYRFEMKAGGISQDHRQVIAALTIHFQARIPAVVYLSVQQNQTELWRTGLNGGAAQQLTSTGGKVYDYAVSRDGEQIAYSVTNAQGGVDLWLMSRDGSHSRLLVDCGIGHCTLPAWAPGGKQIAYHRYALNPTEDPATSGIWAVDLASGQTDYILAGAGAIWSPDGTYLAIPDSKNNTIRVLNIQTGKGIQLQGSVDFFPTWTPDSTKLIYSDLQTAGALPFLVLNQIDLRTNHVSRFLSNAADKTEYGIPAISPDGKALVDGLHMLEGGPTRQLWSMQIDGSHKQAITTQERFTNASYSWDPSGSRVLFQRSDLGSSQPSPQIMLWERATGQTRAIIDGALPAWLP